MINSTFFYFAFSISGALSIYSTLGACVSQYGWLGVPMSAPLLLAYFIFIIAWGQRLDD